MKINIIYSFLNQAISLISSSLFILILSKFLGFEEFNTYNIFVTLSGLFILFFDFGIGSSYPRDLASNPSKFIQELNIIYTFKGLLFFIYYTFLVLFSIYFYNVGYNEIFTLTLVSAYIYLTSLFDFLVSALNSLKLNNEIFRISLLLRLLSIAFVSLMYFFALSLDTILFALILILIASNILCVNSIVSHQHNKLKFDFSFYLFKERINKSIVLALVPFFEFLLLRTDKLILPFYSKEEILSNYIIIIFIITSFSMLNISVVKVLYVYFTQIQEKKNLEKKDNFIRKSIGIILIISFFFMGINHLFSEKLLFIIYDNKFSYSKELILFLNPVIIFYSIFGLVQYFLIASKKYRKLIEIYLIAILLCGTFQILFYGTLGYKTAIYSLYLAFSTINILGLKILFKKDKIIEFS